MLARLRGGGGELGNLKTLTYGFTIFTQCLQPIANPSKILSRCATKVVLV
jgi:hypothetical protein